jgi:RNA-binding motif protein, X-linked 2
MNAIRQTALLNKRELENATAPSASWHVDYRDTAWLYVGGLPNDLSEGDVAIIFSQYGNPTHLNLIRDKETGKSRGFGFVKYEDQRSCDLAVDNLGGAEVLGRMLRVDHTRYKRKEGEDEETFRIEAREREQLGGDEADETDQEDGEKARKKHRKLLKEEKELQEMLAIQAAGAGEDEDPMRDYLIREKREEVERAKEKRRHKHKHTHDRRRDAGDAPEADDAPERSRQKRSRRHDESRGEPTESRFRREDASDRLPRRQRRHKSRSSSPRRSSRRD